MSADAIKNVAEAIQKRLVDAYVPKNAEDTKRQFTLHVGPLNDDEAKEVDFVLFLYRVAVSGELRNSVHVIPRDEQTFDAALPLDLFFLLTGGNTTTGGEVNALADLGRAMQVLNDQPVLRNVNVAGEATRISLAAVSSEEMSRIWALFPTVNYRTSVAYLVTPVWIDPEVAPAQGKPVLSQTLRVRQGTGAEAGHAV